MLSQVGLESLGEFTPREHDASAAAFTLQANISAEARNGPLVRTAWMLFAEAEMVIEAQVWEHDWRSEIGKLTVLNIINES